MPRIIVKCRYIKSIPAHRSNLVGYMATREGVDKEIAPDQPATKKQEEMIARLLRSAPDARDMFEYEDYVTKPSAVTASELISQALEQNADRFTDRKIFLEYIANRPRVQKLGAHGLFGDTDAPVDLAEVQRDVAEHPGNVWTNVVSLRREDAARLGYDNATAWRGLMRDNRNTIAECMRIKNVDHFRWYAAFHDEGCHPHIHFIAYSTDPKEAYLTKQGIDGIRSVLARAIFKQDLQQIYSEQTLRRDALNRESLAVMREMCDEMRSGVCDNPRIGELMMTLADRLSKTGGKKVYGYLKADVKAIVDAITDELAADPRVAACYAAWYEMRNQVLQTYADKLPDAPVFIDAPALDYTQDYDDEPELDDDPAYRADWSDWYKLARDFLYGTRTQPPDFDEGHRLLLMEANNGNALAMHDLGRMYADGLGREADAGAAHDWYAKAIAGFIAVEGTTRKPYIQYRIGKMYAAGLGTEQDYSQAAEWFGKAATHNHKYAQYSLGALYYRGQGVAQDYAQAFSLYRQSSEQGNAYASYEMAKMLRDGIGCAQDTEQSAQYFQAAFSGFQSMEAERSDDKLQYRLGQMLRDGVGMEPDTARAREYFEASAKLGNPHAQYALAKMIIQAGGDAGQIAEAVSGLTKSADGGNPFAQYSLGKLYRDGTHVDKDIAKAATLLTLSAEQDNEYAQYALGKLYLAGEDMPKDVPAAIHWLTASAEQGNEFAQYALGKLYLAGEDVPKDVPAAVRWLTESAEQGNQFSQYQLGKLFLLGRDVERDRKQAVQWFTLSAEQGNEYAQWFLDHIDDYHNALLISSATGLLRGLSRLFDDQRQKQTARADHIDRKRARELREKRQAQGHARDEQMHSQIY